MFEAMEMLGLGLSSSARDLLEIVSYASMESESVWSRRQRACKGIGSCVGRRRRDWRRGLLCVRSKMEGREVESPVLAMRRILDTPGLHQGPACFDALSAKLVEKAGFEFTFMSGFSVSAARFALPDTGLISYGEMVDQGRQITTAVSIPVIGDGDNGYGNAINVKRTVRGYIRAGFAGILLEDQVSPKTCGHTKVKKVVSREEACIRIKAAVDARRESLSDIVIVGRTDARQAVSLEEALWRVQAFADAGADVLFIDALASEEEMQAFCNVAGRVPKMVNMLEGGGKSPILTPIILEDLGFRLVSYPLSLLGVSIHAMQKALQALKNGHLPPPSDLPSFEEIKQTVGFEDYYAEEQHYATLHHASESPISDATVTSERSMSLPSLPSIDDSSLVPQSEDSEEEMQKKDADYLIPFTSKDADSSSSRSNNFNIWSRTLRVKITDTDDIVKLDIRIPAGFLDGLAKIIPGVAGMNLSVMLDEAAFHLNGNLGSGEQLIDMKGGNGDRIQIYLQ